jgi:hypothetical protein
LLACARCACCPPGCPTRSRHRAFGTSFRWLLASSILTNIGDGIALAAGPLLVASQSRDLGTPIGGLLARQFGITAPFWFGFFGSAILVAALWREFDQIVHASEVPVLA